MIRSTLRFGAVSVVLIAVVGVLLSLLWQTPAARRALVVSGLVALVVQMVAFPVVKIAAPTNVMAGWGIGMLLRFAALAVYGLVAANAVGASLAPALISLVSYFFVTSLVEPTLLRP